MFGITGPMIAASKSNVGSFVRCASFELEEGYNDLKSRRHIALVKSALIDLEVRQGNKAQGESQRERLNEWTPIGDAIV